MQQQSGADGSSFPSLWPNPDPGIGGFGDVKTAQFLNSLEDPDALSQLPAFIRPLPSKIAADDVNYLQLKGALTLPHQPLQNALLRAFVEYVHPYMPLLELHDFLAAINSRDGLYGQVSLFLYQAVMFASTAFVDVRCLKEAGYPSRKAARKAFFQKTRVSPRPPPPPPSLARPSADSLRSSCTTLISRATVSSSSKACS